MTADLWVTLILGLATLIAGAWAAWVQFGPKKPPKVATPPVDPPFESAPVEPVPLPVPDPFVTHLKEEILRVQKENRRLTTKVERLQEEAGDDPTRAELAQVKARLEATLHLVTLKDADIARQAGEIRRLEERVGLLQLRIEGKRTHD